MKQRFSNGYAVGITDMTSDIAKLLSFIDNLTDHVSIHRATAKIRDELLLIQQRENDWVDATGYYNPEQYAGEHP